MYIRKCLGVLVFARRGIKLRLMHRYIALLFVGLVILNPAARPVEAQGDDASWILAQLNALRQSRGVGILTLNAHLITSATEHSNYLSTHSWGDPHVEDNGSTPSSRAWAAGYPGRLVSENVVGGSTATKEWGWTWWLNSPIHYQNMTLGQWTDVGIGVAQGPYGRFFTMDFGTAVYGVVAGATQPTPAPIAESPPEKVDSVQRVSSIPTRRPTPLPTRTPLPTLTPSITYTPRATFTPTSTATSVPPTSTAIVMEVTGEAPATPVAVALNGTAPGPISASTIGGASQPPASPDILRVLIPWALMFQAAGVAGMIVRAVWQRRKR